MNSRIFVGVVLLTLSIQLLCSHKMQRPVAIDLDELEQSDMRPISRHSSKYMGVRRELSRGYNRLMQQFTSLQMQQNPKKRDFVVFCQNVQIYTKENLDNLAKNRLLYDDGSAHVGNDFNDVLLKQMREFAWQHHFSDEWVPFTVVEDPDFLNEDERTIQSSESDVRDPEIEEEVEKRIRFAKWLQKSEEDMQRDFKQPSPVVDKSAQDVVAALLLKKD